MTFHEFLGSIGIHSELGFWGIVIFLGSIGIEIVPKIKWNPWSALLKWIGGQFNSKIDAKMETVRKEIKELDEKVDKVQEDLTRHVEESEIKSLQDTRRDILSFANSCMNGTRHTQEQFKFVIKQCDSYETYIEQTGIKNGEITDAIKEIHRLNSKCLQENSYLKEGELT